MQVDSLVQLVGSGNEGTVEEEWLKLVENKETSPRTVARYGPVLAEMVKRGDKAQAETLAWTAIEALNARFEPMEILPAAGALLQALKDSDTLRKEVATLYRKAHGDRPALEALITEAGLEGGRPARRAVRTLEVCLTIQPGDYVVERHEPAAGRVLEIAPEDWEIRFIDQHGKDKLGPVEFADRFQPADPNDFVVLKQFHPDLLRRRLDDHPEQVVIDLCRARGNVVDSHDLEELLTPDPIDPAEWKKWWNKARAALKSVPHVVLEGRSPHVVKIDDAIKSLEARRRAEFEELRDPVEQWALVETYLRECKQQKLEPDLALLQTFHQHFRQAAERHVQQNTRGALRDALLTRRCAKLCGEASTPDWVNDLLKNADDFDRMIGAIEDDKLLCEAFEGLKVAQPEAWVEMFLERLTNVPASVCDYLGKELVKAGVGRERFGPIVDKAVAAPLENHEILLWVYDGPSYENKLHAIPRLTFLTRILGVLSDLRRDAGLDRDRVNQIVARSRSVLGARKCERFRECIDALDPNMAQALRDQIKRLDRLGRALQQDMLSALEAKYQIKTKKKSKPKPWLRDDVIFVTPKGMKKRREELKLHEVKMKENAKAIGAAAEHGDLSENSEYKYALEERDFLQSQWARMQDEMSKAQVIEVEKVPTDHVGVGSKVTIRNVVGEEVFELTFVGPWDASLDDRRYYYKAPVAQQIMGLKIGESVHLDVQQMKGEFEIIKIENGLF